MVNVDFNQHHKPLVDHHLIKRFFSGLMIGIVAIFCYIIALHFGADIYKIARGVW